MWYTLYINTSIGGMFPLVEKINKIIAKTYKGLIFYQTPFESASSINILNKQDDVN